MRVSSITTCLVSSLAMVSALPVNTPADAYQKNMEQKKAEMKKEAMQELMGEIKAANAQKTQVDNKGQQNDLMDQVMKGLNRDQGKTAAPVKGKAASSKSTSSQLQTAEGSDTFFPDQVLENQAEHLLQAFKHMMTHDDEKKEEAKILASVENAVKDFLAQDDETNQDQRYLTALAYLIALQNEQRNSMTIPLPQLQETKVYTEVANDVGTAYGVDTDYSPEDWEELSNSISEAEELDDEDINEKLAKLKEAMEQYHQCPNCANRKKGQQRKLKLKGENKKEQQQETKKEEEKTLEESKQEDKKDSQETQVQ